MDAMVDRRGEQLDATVQRGHGRLELVLERIKIPSSDAASFPTLQRCRRLPLHLASLSPARPCIPRIQHPHGRQLASPLQMYMCSGRGWGIETQLLLTPVSGSILFCEEFMESHIRQEGATY
jgi:hypothetical protein